MQIFKSKSPAVEGIDDPTSFDLDRNPLDVGSSYHVLVFFTMCPQISLFALSTKGTSLRCRITSHSLFSRFLLMLSWEEEIVSSANILELFQFGSTHLDNAAGNYLRICGLEIQGFVQLLSLD